MLRESENSSLTASARLDSAAIKHKISRPVRAPLVMVGEIAKAIRPSRINCARRASATRTCQYLETTGEGLKMVGDLEICRAKATGLEHQAARSTLRRETEPCRQVSTRWVALDQEDLPFGWPYRSKGTRKRRNARRSLG
jgi:hypothetical protein